MVIREFWPIDGKDHSDVSEEGLYHNSKIENFLHSEQRTLIIAAKGMGKTLLLRAKKSMLEKASEGHLIIPRNQEYDYPEIRWSLPPKGLEDYNLWKNLWLFSFIFSALSHREHLSASSLKRYVEKLAVSKEFKASLVDDFENQRARAPSYYLCEILQLGIRNMNKFFHSCNDVDEMSNQFITSSTCIFIDAFDQTLTERFGGQLSVWKSAQIGLIYAAHRIRNSNKHMKVFASIRYEAWANFYSDDRQVIKGQALVLEYSKHELKQMFLHGVKKYTDYKTIEDFFGLETIKNGCMDKEEIPFDYMYRHSVGTPRSIMSFGHALGGANLQDLDINARRDRFRHLINQDGAEHLYADYLVSQRRIFLSTLYNDERIKALLKLVPSNVLPGTYLKQISQDYAEKFGLIEEDAHPFCELLNVGVLGAVRRDAITHKWLQNFRKPQEFDWKMQNILTEDGLYLFHPSIHDNILQNRGDAYYINPHNIIGDGLEWDNSKRIFPQIFISHSSGDKEQVEPLVEQLHTSLTKRMPCEIWYDNHCIPFGSNIFHEIQRGVQESDIVLVFLSATSLHSGWVTQEWRHKYEQEIVDGRVKVVCCILDDTPNKKLPEFLRGKRMVYLLGEPDKVAEPINALVLNIEQHLNHFWFPGDIS